MQTELTEDTIVEKDDRVWMVVYTRPRYEKKVDNTLISKRIESYCPTRKVEKQWTDRKKIIEEVIFRSYVFVRINETERLEVLQTDGVMNFIFFDRKPATIRDEEIDLIKMFLNEKSHSVSTIDADLFQPDTLVKINHGVFMDNEGTILRSNKKKVYVQLTSLSQVLVIEFPVEHVTPIG